MCSENNVHFKTNAVRIEDVKDGKCWKVQMCFRTNTRLSSSFHRNRLLSSMCVYVWGLTGSPVISGNGQKNKTDSWNWGWKQEQMPVFAFWPMSYSIIRRFETIYWITITVLETTVCPWYFQLFMNTVC